MRPSSSPSIPLSSASKLPYVSFYERYERIFQCDGGCIITEDKDVSLYQYPQSRSDEATDEQQNNSNQITTTEALHLNVSSSSYQGASRKHQESPPPVVTTVMYKHQASYNNDEDTFDIDARRTQSRTKTQAHTEAANNEYFTNRIQQLQVLIHNSNDQSQITQIQMALPILSSPDTTTQQQQQRHQQQQQQCQCHSPTPINKSNNTYATPKPKSKSKPAQYEMCMPSSFRLKERQQHGRRSGKHTDDSESTQSTQSMSESEGDDLSSLESHVGGGPDEEDTPVSILRRRTVKFGTNAETTTTTNDNDSNRGRVVRFEKDTQFPDPKERPSSTRKHVPRMFPRQKEEYDRMNNNTYPRRRRSAQQQQQSNVLSLLIHLFVQHRPL